MCLTPTRAEGTAFGFSRSPILSNYFTSTPCNVIIVNLHPLLMIRFQLTMMTATWHWGGWVSG